MKLFSGTYGNPATAIIPLGKMLPGGRDNWFGGIFASDSEDVARSHGDVMQVFEVDDEQVLRHNDLRHELLYSGAAISVLRAVLKDVFRREFSEEAMFDLAEFVAGDKSLFQDDFVDGNDALISVLGAYDEGTADWCLQGISGEVARRMGYAAVEMPDEHGASYLVLTLAA